MSTLRGRIGLALLVFGLTTLLVVGGSLWVALRDLHREAAIGALTELSLPYAGFFRQVGGGIFRRPGPDGQVQQGDIIERIRDARQRRNADEAAVTALVEDFNEAIESGGISAIVVQGERTVIVNAAEGDQDALDVIPALDLGVVRGVVTTGSTEIADMGSVLYAATPIRDPPRNRAAPYLVLTRPDDSATLATADLVRAMTIAGLVLLVIGIPIAVWLSRSVTYPLRRLSAATESVAAGRVPEPLPTGGPIEVADASAAFNAMAAEVGATREAQRQLLADIRHDLRTPLTVIGGFSEALKDGTATGETAVRAADAIADETGRLERMLDDLDHLTVPGVAGPPLRLETLDSREVAASAVERFEPEAVNRGQTLTLASGAESAAVTADRDALDRVLGNIVANALNHAPAPGGHVTIEVARTAGSHLPQPLHVWATRPALLIAVRDDGAGIPADALPHVFDRFYRADPSRTSRGSGLGLAIVRDLADALNGQAFAENPSGGGARVGIVLPLTRDGAVA